MKALLAVIALALPMSASAADFASCKAKLQPIAAEYEAYVNVQTAECVAELSKSSKDRSTFAILRHCKTPSAILTPIKAKSAAACDECRGVDAKLATACGDEGVVNFINRVKAL